MDTWMDNKWGNKSVGEEGECTYRANERPCWDHLDGKRGTVKIENGALVFKPKKDPFGNNCYVVRSENLEYNKKW